MVHRPTCVVRVGKHASIRCSHSRTLANGVVAVCDRVTGRIDSRFSAIEGIVGESRLPRGVLEFRAVPNFIVAERDGGIVGRLSGGNAVCRIVLERTLDTASIEDRRLATGRIIRE